MISPGTHIAKIVSHAFSEDEDGNLKVVVGFETADGGQKLSWWSGFSSDKAVSYTVNQLLRCGLKGNNPAGEIEIGKLVELVVEHETHEGKTRAKIKFINEVGAVKNAIPQDLAKSKLAALQEAVALARIKNKRPDTDDIPF